MAIARPKPRCDHGYPALRPSFWRAVMAPTPVGAGLGRLTTTIDKTPVPAANLTAGGPSPVRLERRTRRRLPLALPARITFEAGPGQPSRTVPGRTSNLSSRGAYLTSSEPFAPGQVLLLAFDVPADRARSLAIKIRCRATVVRADTAPPRSGLHGVAVRFLRAGIPKEPASHGRISANKIARMAPPGPR